MKSIRSVFIGGKQIGVNCLRELVRNGEKPTLVIANSEDTGKDTWHESLVKVANAEKLPLVKGKKVKDPAVIAKIQKIAPDIIFCIGSMELIPKEVLDVPRLGTLNIHPALLPKYRGRFSTAHAIFNGEKETGVTVHWMDAGIDSGPVVLQKSFPLTDEDTGRTAYDKFTTVGTELFGEFLTMLKSGKSVKGTPQNEAEATYYPKSLPGGGQIDWSWDGEKIKRFIRAMTFEPFPPPDFKLGEKEMVIVDKNLLAQHQLPR